MVVKKIWEKNWKKIFLRGGGGGGMFDNGNVNWCILGRAFFCRTGHFSVKPGFFLSNHAFCCRTNFAPKWPNSEYWLCVFNLFGRRCTYRVQFLKNIKKLPWLPTYDFQTHYLRLYSKFVFHLMIITAILRNITNSTWFWVTWQILNNEPLRFINPWQSLTYYSCRLNRKSCCPSQRSYPSDTTDCSVPGAYTIIAEAPGQTNTASVNSLQPTMYLRRVSGQKSLVNDNLIYSGVRKISQTNVQGIVKGKMRLCKHIYPFDAHRSTDNKDRQHHMSTRAGEYAIHSK